MFAYVYVERLQKFYAQALIGDAGDAYDRLMGLSSRKPTHVKWYLGGGMPNSLTKPVTWANDYQQPMPGTQSYVNKYHNHRGRFVSIHLGQRGYVEDKLTAPDMPSNDGTVWIPEDWGAAVTTVYKPGDISIMSNTRDIHRVYDTSDALTFIVTAPRERRVTEVFNDDCTYTTYPDLYSQLIGSQIRILEGLVEALPQNT